MNGDTAQVQAEYERLGPSYRVRTALNSFGDGPSEQGTLEELLGDVSDLTVLDAACAAGRLTAWLARKGAHAVGLDVTTTMLRAAWTEVAGAGLLVQADLAEPLPFCDGSFDLVLSAFTLHYLRDWEGVLGEFHRVLRPNSALVLSVHHPFNDVSFATRHAYFQTDRAVDSWIASDGNTTQVHFYRRPLSAIVEAFHQAGFLIERMLEAPPDHFAGPEARERLQPFFLCIRAVKTRHMKAL